MTLFSEPPLSQQEIRQLIRQRRYAFTSEQQRQYGQQAITRMFSFSPVVLAYTVAVFLSFDGKFDTQPLIDQLWRASKRVHLPILHLFSPGNLLFLHYHPHSDLVTSRLEIQEPRLDVRDALSLSQPDVLITPSAALDEVG